MNGRNLERPIAGAVCASRASALAMIQTRTVAAKLAQFGIATTILNVTTTGDRVQDRSLASIGAESLFVKELEAALRERRADYAVHSAKDLPSTIPDDMRIVAISAREDPRDVLCSEHYASLRDLPSDARVGTSSPRRRAQLAALRADLRCVDIRGNVDTRLRKLREGEVDAVVLAAAGLHRLQLRPTYAVAFDPAEILPAVGQGALAVEMRAGDDELAAQLRRAVNDDRAERAVLCERAALRVLRGGCQAPIGIHASFDGDVLSVHGAVAAPGGTVVMRERRSRPAADVPAAQALGEELARELLQAGALEILSGPA
jgi:hydroxymethylbilane synthase